MPNNVIFLTFIQISNISIFRQQQLREPLELQHRYIRDLWQLSRALFTHGMNCRLCLKLRSLVSREVSSRIRTGSPYVVLPHHWSRPYSVASGNDVLQPPSSTGSAKVYSAKIKQLVDDISKLTVLEISDLNDLLKVSVLFLN